MIGTIGTILGIWGLLWFAWDRNSGIAAVMMVAAIICIVAG